jgi:signal transduction histidine kinase
MTFSGGRFVSSPRHRHAASRSQLGLVAQPLTALAASALVVAGGMFAFEVFMRPSAGERLELLGLFLVVAVVTVIATIGLARLANRSRSLRRSIAAAGLITVGVIGLAVALGGWRMFLSGHDLHLLAVVLLVGAGLGVVFALSVAHSLTADLAVMRRTVERVAADDLSARTGVERADELGAVTAALDQMIDRLASTEKLRQADEVARRNLLAAIGHDLRTPLAALQATVEALQDGLAPDPDRYLAALSQHVAALGGLVDDLFLLARIEAGDLGVERSPLDLAELADETIETMAPIAYQRGVELRLDAAGGVPVLGRAEELGRVMRNLVDNAIRHAPAPSQVVVRVLRQGGPGPGPGDGAGATVEVLDQGPGFRPEFVPSAFDSFVRAEPSRSRGTGGAGLGLAIAKGVVEAHGGSIWARPGPGGQVGFHLPQT